ncbi:LysR family transcriptional regulator [Streptomyces sp. NPDC002143]
MDIRQIRHFLAVAETLNYARAAERLFMAASPLSRSIQQLENEIGGPLFNRGTRRVELTALGASLIPYAERAVSDFDLLKREMRRRVKGHQEIQIGMRSVPSELLKTLIDEVVKEIAPDAEVRVHPMDSHAQVDALVARRLTLGLINRRVDDRRIDYLPVMRERAAMALPNQPRYADLTVVRPQDVSELRLLLQPGYAASPDQDDDYLRAAAEVQRLDYEIVGGVAALITTGDSCCFTVANPNAPWHRYLLGDGVVIRPLPDSYPVGSTYLAWRVDRNRDDDLGPIIDRARTVFPLPLER